MILRINLGNLDIFKSRDEYIQNHPVPLRTRRVIKENAYVYLYCILLAKRSYRRSRGWLKRCQKAGHW